MRSPLPTPIRLPLPSRKTPLLFRFLLPAYINSLQTFNRESLETTVMSRLQPATHAVPIPASTRVLASILEQLAGNVCAQPDSLVNSAEPSCQQAASLAAPTAEPLPQSSLLRARLLTNATVPLDSSMAPNQCVFMDRPFRLGSVGLWVWVFGWHTNY